MFKWLFSRHKHKYTNWHVVKVLRDDYGHVKLIQYRTCIECGYVQMDTQEK